MNTPQQRWTISLMMVFLVILTTSSRSMALVVSEIMYHPTDDGETLEFIELYNNRAVFEELDGYAFTNGIDYAFEPNAILEAKAYCIIARDPNAVEAAYGMTGVLGPYTGRLSNDGERIDLSNGNGGILLSLRYDDNHPWPKAADGTGHSLVLANLGGDPDEGSSWSASTLIGGTPGQADQVQAEPEDPTLVTLVTIGHDGRYFKGLTEPSPGPNGEATTDWTQIDFDDDPGTTAWLDGPSGYGYSNDAAELQYIGTPLNDMNGNYLSVYARLPFTLTAEQIASFTQLQAEVHYDDDFVLYLNGTRVGDSGQISGNPPAYDQTGGQASDPDAAVADMTNQIDLLVPGTNVLAIQAHNASLSGSSDCLGSPILRAIVEAPETEDDPRGRLVINEVLANSDADPGLDWIELYNPGPIAIDLSHVYLSDEADDLVKYKIPDAIVLEPGQYWAVSEAAASDGLPFGLNFTGETVYVTVATGEPAMPSRVLDALACDATPPDVTFGRFPDGSNRLGLLASATFNLPNTPAINGDIVINEIMYHHATRDESYEYVELYNQGSDAISLAGWAFTDGIDYTFANDVALEPGGYLVVAQDPNVLAATYEQLLTGVNLFGPYSGSLNDHCDHLELSYPLAYTDTNGLPETCMIVADEVTYFDGGRWPTWADGQGASLELRDPRSDNDLPDAWADSDESDKAAWEPFSYTINSNNGNYSHSRVSTFDVILLNRGEILLDDIELHIDGTDYLDNNGFEDSLSDWRTLGNHVQSHATTADTRSGSRALHLISTGHGDPGANRVNQSISSVNANTVTFSGWARWQRGCPFLLLRTTRDRSPVQPPRPAHAFELTMPVNLGTPGLQNTAFVANRAPDILEVKHEPVLPAGGEEIVVTARITDVDGVLMALLNYRSEGSSAFTSEAMVDDGTGDDVAAGDGIYTATIPGASTGTMRAFYISAFDGTAYTRFPAQLAASAEVPERTCLVRVGDTLVHGQFATYRLWYSNDVLSTFRARPTLSNELLDCTFVYNDSEVFYNCGLRHRGSPFLRSGSGRTPTPGDSRGFRIDFNPDQRFGGREEINLDGGEGGSRGPLQERASYWFYRHMGLQYSRSEYVRLIMNGSTANIYNDVQKIDGDYVEAWFPNDTDGYIHKIDDYFEYSADGTSYSNLDEGLKFDSSHPLLKETYRWGFEKRSHRENDDWQHLFDFAVAMNTSSSLTSYYERAIESVIHPEHFAKVLAIRHAVGDWDSYGYTRGKNNYFYYAAAEGKWYLLPWDIDFTLGSGHGTSTNLLSVESGEFPEVYQFVNYPKYEAMYWAALEEMVNGPWQTSYGTSDAPTAFDRYLDNAADALVAEGFSDGRRNAIKQFVRSRQSYILSQLPEEDDTPTRTR